MGLFSNYTALPLQVGGGGRRDAAGLDPVAGGEAGAAAWLQRGSGSLAAAASAAAGQSHDIRILQRWSIW